MENKAIARAEQGSGAGDEPYLSIVVTTRNDNHGGDLLFRTQVFVNAVFAQFDRFAIPVELVFVEWNPPPERPRLAEAISWPEECDFVSVRIIEVGEHLHRKYEHADRLPLFQMIAKNVGIRRARGTFVLATNIDIVFSDDLMRFFAARRLRSGRYYRTDRYDVDGVTDAEAAIEAQLRACDSSVIRVCGRYGTRDLRTGEFYRIWLRYSRLPWWAAVLAQIWMSVWARARRPLEGGWGREPLLALGRLTGRSARALLAATRRILRAAKAVPAQLRRCLTVLTHPALWPKVPRALWRSGRGSAGRLGTGSRWRTRVALQLVRHRIELAVDRFREAVLWARALPALHTNGCGDFTLLARTDWEALRAYPELELFSMFIDSIFVYAAYWEGIREAFLPYRIYHLEHSGGFKPDARGLAEMNGRLEDAGIPQIDDARFREYAIEMYRLRGAIDFNGDGWGLAGEALPETAPAFSRPLAVSR